MIDDVSLSACQFGKLCICAVRYALGRRTWVPADIAYIVRNWANKLSDNDIVVIRRDVTEYLVRDSKRTNVVLEDPNVPSWRVLLTAIDKEIAERASTAVEAGSAGFAEDWKEEAINDQG